MGTSKHPKSTNIQKNPKSLNQLKYIKIIQHPPFIGSQEASDHIRDPPQKSKRLRVGTSIHTGPGPHTAKICPMSLQLGTELCKWHLG